jgi:mutual gliding-motility protein MglA
MSEGKARILIWGISGSGKSATLEMIHSKLQASLRGQLRKTPTDIDPTVHYETLPIALGKVGGVESQIEIVAVPGAEDHAITRKQLLDEVDGVVLVIDSSPDRIEANWDMLTELRESLNAYGRDLDDFPVVVQYNKRDLADPFKIEDFHRRTGLTHAAVFETIATTGHGILATLTTISKHVIRARKGRSAAPTPEPVTTIEDAAALESPDLNASSHSILEAAILAEADEFEAGDVEAAVELDFAEPGVQPDWNAVINEDSKPEQALGQTLRIVSAGQAEVDTEGGLKLPLVLGDENGQSRSVLLSLRLDALGTEDGD